MEDEKIRVGTRSSLRQRRNSTDHGSPVVGLSKNGAQTPVKSASQLAAINEDLTSESEDMGAKKTPIIVRTRARVASTLTEENVQSHSSPARRQTRRNSSAMEPSTPTAVRRSTRASSITSDDVSVHSNIAIKTRRTINIDKTFKEEDEKQSTLPVSTRSTGSIGKPTVASKVSPIPNAKATPAVQKATPTADTSTKEKTTEITTPEKKSLTPSLKISKIDVSDYQSPILVSEPEDKIEGDDSIISVVSSENAIGDKSVSFTAVANEEVTLISKKSSRSVLFESISEKSSPAQIYPRTPATKKSLDLDDDADTSYNTQDPVEQADSKTSKNMSMESGNKSVLIENDESSSVQLDNKIPTESISAQNDKSSSPQLNKATPSKKSLDSSDFNINKSVETENNSSFLTQLDSKQTTKNLLDSDANKSIGTVNRKNSSSQLSPKTPTKTKNENDAVSSTPDSTTPKKKSSQSNANKSIGKANDELSSPQLDPKTPVSETLKDKSFESETMNKLQHSQISFTDRASPMLHVKQRTPLKKGVTLLNSSTPINTAAGVPVATEKFKDSPLKDRETVETKGAQSENPTFSRSWSRSVVGKSVDFIDGLARQHPAEEEVIKQTNVSVSSRKSNITIDNSFNETVEDTIDNVKETVARFIHDEAEEAEDDDEDSMDEEEKQYIRDNEIPERDISLGSDDSSVGDAQDDVSASSFDSFIVSDSENIELLDGSGDDLSLDVDIMKDKPLRKSHRIVDSSDEDEVKTEETSFIYTQTKKITTVNRKTNLNERPPKAGLSKSFVEPKSSKTNTKLNKSVGQESNENFNISDVSSLNSSVDTKVSSAAGINDKSNIASPSKPPTKVGLSKSLVEPKSTKKNLKLNNTVGVSSKNENEFMGPALEELNDDVQGTDQLENSADGSKSSSEIEQIEDVASPVPENKRKRSIKATDGEVESTPPFARSPINSVKKKPNYDEILGRCDSILTKALEGKREQKLQNKNPIADDKVQRLKSKKEQKQLTKARRAAALIEIKNQAIEKAEKKRLKKEARALKKSEKPEDDKAEAVAKAINHGIALLSKKFPKASLPIEDTLDVPTEPIQTKSKKRKLNTISDEVVVKKQIKSIDHSDAVIKQGQAKRKQEPPAHDSDAEPVSHGTLKKRKLPQMAREQTSEAQILTKDKAKITSLEKSNDLNIPPLKKIKKHVPTLSNNENNAIPITTVSTKQKKKLNILLTKPENNATPTAVAKPKAFDANILKITPKPAGFKEHSKSSAGQNDKKPKQKKKKEIVERVTVLPKPQWTTSGAFKVSTLSTDTETHDVLRFSSATNFVVASLKPKPQKIKSSASEFKQRATFNDSVKRESSKQLLQRKEKQMVYTRF